MAKVKVTRVVVGSSALKFQKTSKGSGKQGSGAGWCETAVSGLCSLQSMQKSSSLTHELFMTTL